jgi:spermidine synthase
MQLSKHIAQGKLLYLNQNEEAISVSENEHYRWLAFTDEKQNAVIQSVMHKRKPWLLTLPHQTAILLPLLFFKPEKVVELGLGGGNTQRFLKQLSPTMEVLSVEQSCTVIDCFHHYFNPQNIQTNIVNLQSDAWLAQPDKNSSDWLICDIYQAAEQDANHTTNQLQSLIDNISDEGCLSINLPDASDDEVNVCLTILQHLSRNHEIYYFHIPNYLNIVIHLLPKHWHLAKHLKRGKNSFLPPKLFTKWRQFWQCNNEVKRDNYK